MNRLQKEIDADKTHAECLELVQCCLSQYCLNGCLTTPIFKDEGTTNDPIFEDEGTSNDSYYCAYGAITNNTRRKLLNSLFEKEGFGLNDIETNGETVLIYLKYL